MSKEALHINKSEALFATVSGVLVGASPAAPALGGIGLVVATIGTIRYKSRERDHQLERLSEYIRNSSRGIIYQSPEDEHKVDTQ